jgi:outer membrane protein TolC
MFLALLGVAFADPLSLDTAIQLALVHAPDATILQARRDQALGNVGSARAALLPQLSASGTYQHWNEQIEFPNPFDPTGGVLVLQEQETLYGALTASQVVFAPGTFARMASAAGANHAAEANLEGGTSDLSLRVVSVWVGARTAHEVAQVASEVEADAAAHLKVTESQLQAGAATELTVDRARIQVADAHRRLIDATKAEADLLGQLAILVGGPVESLAPLPEAGPAPAEGDATAVARRSDVRAATAAADAARAAANWTVAANWAPTVVANGQYRVTNSPGFTGEYTSWYVGGTVNLPLLDGGLRFTEAKRVNALAVEAQATLERVQALAEEEVRSTTRGMRLAQEQLEVAKQQEAAATRAMTLAERAYEAGAVTSLDVEDARNSALDAAVGRIRAEGGVVLAAYQYRRATADF